MLSELLRELQSEGKKALSLLIDPDKQTPDTLSELLKITNNKPGPNFIFVGGSIVFNGIDETVLRIKKLTNIPVYLFPGSAFQVSNHVDGIMLLSLISGRNPEFLIGNHVLAAPKIKKSGVDVFPTGYLLVDSGTNTSVAYMSNTVPIPYNKTDIAVATAMAGELLGLHAIYLEAGSGAQKPVSLEMINAVRSSINIPLIVGGGINTNEQLKQILDAGADMVVIGTATENNPQRISDFAKITNNFTS